MVNTSPEVDAWFAEREHPLTDAMQLARRLILEADPRVTESGQPAFHRGAELQAVIRAWCTAHQ